MEVSGPSFTALFETLAIVWPSADLRCMNKVSRVRGTRDLPPAGTSPHVSVAPGLLDQPHTVVREPGETDERYQSRVELLAALLDFAAKQE